VITDTNHIAISERSSGTMNRLAVNECPVGRVFVDDPNVIAIAIDGCVQSGKTVVRRPMIGIAASAERRTVVLDRDLLRTVIS
jgi:ferredoxin-like protein FixX